MSVTEVLVSVAGLLLCAALLATVLRTQRPELAVCLSLLAGALVVGLLLGQIAPLAATVRRMLTTGGITDRSFGVVLRAAGVCLLAQMVADTCQDAGETALAGKAELAGRVLLLLWAVPLFEEVLALVVGFINGQAVTG